MHDDIETTNGFNVVLDALRRRKRMAIPIFLGAMAAVLTTVTFLPDIYQSRATVLIERQQIPNELVRSTVTSALETRLQTISQEILSRSRLEALIDRFGLYEDMRVSDPIEIVLSRMRKNIGLELKGEGKKNRDRVTVAFSISFSGRDPERVAAVTNTLASFYIEENLKVRERQASGTSEFLKAQLSNMKTDLEEQEEQVSRFKKQYAGELPHQQEANLAALERLNTQLPINADNQIRVSGSLSELGKELAEAEGTGEGPGALATRINELGQKLRELRKRYSDKYPEVIQVKSEIAQLVEQFHTMDSGGVGQDVASVGNPAVIQVKNSISEAEQELRELKMEEQRTRASIVMYQRRVDSAPLQEQRYLVLMRDYETMRELYDSLLQRQKEAELAESMEQRQKGEQFRIIEPAFPSEQPAAPQRARLYLLGVMFCLGLAAGAVLLAEQLDNSFHTAVALKASSSVPVLVTIPSIVTNADRRRERWRLGVSAAAVSLGLVGIVTVSYFFATENDRLVAILLG